MSELTLQPKPATREEDRPSEQLSLFEFFNDTQLFAVVTDLEQRLDEVLENDVLLEIMDEALEEVKYRISIGQLDGDSSEEPVFTKEEEEEIEELSELYDGDAAFATGPVKANTIRGRRVKDPYG